MATPQKPPWKLAKKPSEQYSLRAALKIVSEHSRALDESSWLSTLGVAGQALREWRDDVVADLGGAENLTTAERAIVDMCARSYLLLSSIDRYVLSLPSPVNRQKHRVFHVVLEREMLVASLARNLERLGLRRRAKPVAQLAEIIREHAAAASATESEVP
jgi:hypothetical protein